MTDWDALVQEQSAAVLRIACRILSVGADAEEVAQDVFVEAWQMQATQEVRNWPGLLRRMAVLRSLDRLRRRRVTFPYDEQCLADDRTVPPDVIMRRELAHRLRQSLCDLPEQQAAAFSLFYFDHCSRDEIADELATTPGAVSSALSKARRALRSSLTELHEDMRHVQD